MTSVEREEHNRLVLILAVNAMALNLLLLLGMLFCCCCLARGGNSGENHLGGRAAGNCWANGTQPMTMRGLEKSCGEVSGRRNEAVTVVELQEF